MVAQAVWHHDLRHCDAYAFVDRYSDTVTGLLRLPSDNDGEGEYNTYDAVWKPGCEQPQISTKGPEVIVLPDTIQFVQGTGDDARANFAHKTICRTLVRRGSQLLVYESYAAWARQMPPVLFAQVTSVPAAAPRGGELVFSARLQANSELFPHLQGMSETVQSLDYLGLFGAGYPVVMRQPMPFLAGTLPLELDPVMTIMLPPTSAKKRTNVIEDSDSEEDEERVQLTRAHVVDSGKRAKASTGDDDGLAQARAVLEEVQRVQAGDAAGAKPNAGSRDGGSMTNAMLSSAVISLAGHVINKQEEAKAKQAKAEDSSQKIAKVPKELIPVMRQLILGEPYITDNNIKFKVMQFYGLSSWQKVADRLGLPADALLSALMAFFRANVRGKMASCVRDNIIKKTVQLGAYTRRSDADCPDTGPVWDMHQREEVIQEMLMDNSWRDADGVRFTAPCFQMVCKAVYRQEVLRESSAQFDLQDASFTLPLLAFIEREARRELAGDVLHGRGGPNRARAKDDAKEEIARLLKEHEDEGIEAGATGFGFAIIKKSQLPKLTELPADADPFAD